MQPVFEKRGESLDLVVLVHAYLHSPESLQPLRDVVAERLPNADILRPRLPSAKFSTARTSAIVSEILQAIDVLWASQKYRRIVLVGHSMGALIARKVYVCACGESPEAPFEPELAGPEARPWAEKVERLILLAGMNRGWQVSHHLSIKKAFVWTIGVWIGNLMALIGRPPLIFAFRRGAPFITELRIQWIRMRQKRLAGVGGALTVQLLGSIDDMVSPNDNIDLVSGSDFVYLDVPFSGHSNVIEMDNSKEGKGRRDVFEGALVDAPNVLIRRQILPADTGPDPIRPEITDVIFVIHGIRDEGYWTHKIARKAMELGQAAGNGRKFATETSSYGYFPMLPFLLPSQRRARVEWFMDQYTEALARYPNATCSFMGHSNGTYLLAKALEVYRCCRFRHVVFAGSVVRRKYRWHQVVKERRVEAVLNYVASGDWVVAFFPGLFEMIPVQDLGNAGHTGFEAGEVRNLGYVRGSHGAALSEHNWMSIAGFLVDGKASALLPELKADDRAKWVVIPGRAPLLVWVFLASLAAAIFVLIYLFIPYVALQWVLSGLLAIALWNILTRL